MLSKIMILLFASLHLSAALKLGHYKMAIPDAGKEEMTLNKGLSSVDASNPLVFDLLSNSTTDTIHLRNVGLRKTTINSERPAIGVCIAGLARTFTLDLVHKRYKDLIIPSLQEYGDVSSFFLLGTWDSNRMGKMHKGSEANYNEIQQAVSLLNPSAALLLQEVETFTENEKCELPDEWKRVKVEGRKLDDLKTNRLRRWYFQWTKVKGCYTLMEKYETEQGRAFNYMVRMRSDLAFFQDLKPSVMFQPDKIIVPKGIIGHKWGGLNDHIASCPRELCAPYFTIVDTYDNCTGPWEDSLGHSAGGDDGNQLLGFRLKKFLNITVEQVFIEYTVHRGCPGKGPECDRLPGRFRERCLAPESQCQPKKQVN